MNSQAVVQTILTNAIKKIETDVGELLGQELSHSDLHFVQVDKSAYFFDNPRGKSILTRLGVSGDTEGQAYLVMPVSAAIQLGGTLIMLPEDSIAEKLQSEEMGPDETDAFAEIANILTGSLSRTFEEQYSKKLHLSKGDSEDLVPTKVDPESEAPFPPANYLLCTTELKLDDTALGPLDLLFPVELLGLEAEPPAAQETPAEPIAAPETSPEANTEQPAAETDGEPAAPAAETPPEAAPEAEGPTPAEVKRNKSVVDLILKTAVQKIDAELGALMGEFVATSDVQLQMLTKEQYFLDQPRDTLVLSHLDVSGDKEGKAYIAIEQRDASYLGGTLIMLPEDEIQAQIDAGTFDGEAEDAYGEIANILAGVISTTFEAKHPKKYHFVRKETECVTPTLVDPADESPFPPSNYYVCGFGLTVGEKELSRLEFVFPAEILEIQSVEIEVPTASVPSGETAEKVDAHKPQEAGFDTVDGAASGSGAEKDIRPRDPALLIVSDDMEQATLFQDALTDLGYKCISCALQDDLKTPLHEYQVVLIYLLMKQVNEQGFAAAIKLQSAANPVPPMVAGGPEWTRSTVLRAVRYGVQDILITPASATEILEKAQGLLQQKAAG